MFDEETNHRVNKLDYKLDDVEKLLYKLTDRVEYLELQVSNLIKAHEDSQASNL